VEDPIERPEELEATAASFEATAAPPQGRRAPSETFRAGFVGIVGSPNVGKSTITNAILGEDLCIATSKAQTTRHRILGVVTGDEHQLVLSDTPGILAEPAYKLQDTMMTAAKAATRDAECLLFVTDIFEDEALLAAAEWTRALLPQEDAPPVVVCLNKVDLFGDDEDGRPFLGEAARSQAGSLDDCVARVRQAFPEAAAIVPASGLTGEGVEDLVAAVAANLPLSDYLYDPEYFTDRPQRFFVAEIIREQILRQFSKEIPYACEVRVDRFKERMKDGRPFVAIDAVVLVARESQKGIVVGKGGAGIKELGSAARARLEEFLQAKVHLALRVKVSKDWRSDDAKLRGMGYIQ